MPTLHYRLVNVFTRNADPLSGNPLCVFEDGSGLDDATMQALARQFNLSETTFLLPPTLPGAQARSPSAAMSSSSGAAASRCSPG
jgi:PhzF family phenazine biosynthesis protein